MIIPHYHFFEKKDMMFPWAFGADFFLAPWLPVLDVGVDFGFDDEGAGSSSENDSQPFS